MTELKAEFKTDIAELKAELSKEFTNQIKEVRKGLNQLQGGIAVLGVVVILLQLWTKLTSRPPINTRGMLILIAKGLYHAQMVEQSSSPELVRCSSPCRLWRRFSGS